MLIKKIKKPGMAAIGKIVDVKAIHGADRIKLLTVVCGPFGRWQGVGDTTFNVDDIVFVCFQDAILPTNPRWAFLEKHHWRVKMCRFKGVPSECLILKPWGDTLPIGTDITDFLGVLKYEKILESSFKTGEALSTFPSFIPKTDEENFQRIENWQGLLMSKPSYVTIKYDGTSCTVYKNIDSDELHVCSRNQELKRGDNLYWNFAEKANLQALVPPGYAVQFELIGPGIQGNPCGLSQHEGRIFTCYDLVTRTRLSIYNFIPQTNQYIRLARMLPSNTFIPQTSEHLYQLADQYYENGAPAEGVVIRATDQSFSFKVLNLKYKD